MILNFVYKKLLAAGAPQEIIDKFTRISPIAWTHTLLTGRYSFMKSNGQIDVEAMAQILKDHVRQHFWIDEGEGLDQKSMVQSDLDIGNCSETIGRVAHKLSRFFSHQV